MDELPSKVYSRAFAPVERLEELLGYCNVCGVSQHSFRALEELCRMDPVARLVRNLKITIGQMSDGPIFGVLGEGLTAEEQSFLAELDQKGLPIRTIETAHGLHNVHERRELLKRMRRPFRLAVAAATEFLRESGLEGGITP